MADDRDAAAGTGAPDPVGHNRASGRIARLVVAAAGVVFVYYAVPVGDLPSAWGIAVAAGGLLLGLAALVYVAVRQIRAMAASRPGDPGVRLDVLVLVVIVVVPLFALGCYAIEQADGSQFADLETKTDALYFTLATLATVGYGDVHAAGQWARAFVSLQIVFNVVFVAALVSLVGSEFRARAVERRHELQR